MIPIPNLQSIVAMDTPRYRRPVPDCWSRIVRRVRGECWGEPGGLRVIASRDTMVDSSTWLHVSVSRQDRLPSWEDLRRIKDEFVGRSEIAIQVLPPDREYVDCHPYCLHLWSPDEGE